MGPGKQSVVVSQVPPGRWQAFTAVAAFSRTEKVLVVCESQTVRRQYERAVLRLGGNLDNVIFRVVPGVSATRTTS